ncbi:MAG: hypothetical protein JO171_04225 [Paludibacterium sp.]|uniref:hypothetical protein n=1 Tax=Paludibacterium sp. TaxID=1917523 RepID=UPI0025EF47AB|nr:hypothetical protein [Paludibacterium sp.]MBV8046330.1 hypothetical protein [Paludibacterium sp.]MBV8649554.1 hypothetical protein [Paludibacterium sp.]
MYDWNALWHTHQGYRTGHAAGQEDINQLGGELSATLIKPAAHAGDIAVYDQGDQFLLVGHDQGLQLLHLAKHALFDIQARFLPDSGAEPCIEVYVKNQATQEEDSWRSPVHRDEQGQIRLGKRLLSEGTMPPMPFDNLSFTDNARFRDLLYSAWQDALPRLQQETAAWRPGGADTSGALARYQALMRFEQARLGLRFGETARARLSAALADCRFDDPADCRGLWLRVEKWWLDHAAEEDMSELISALASLDYASEIALVEWLKK